MADAIKEITRKDPTDPSRRGFGRGSRGAMAQHEKIVELNAAAKNAHTDQARQLLERANSVNNARYSERSFRNRPSLTQQQAAIRDKVEKSKQESPQDFPDLEELDREREREEAQAEPIVEGELVPELVGLGQEDIPDQSRVPDWADRIGGPEQWDDSSQEIEIPGGGPESGGLIFQQVISAYIASPAGQTFDTTPSTVDFDVEHVIDTIFSNSGGVIGISKVPNQYDVSVYVCVQHPSSAAGKIDVTMELYTNSGTPAVIAGASVIHSFDADDEYLHLYIGAIVDESLLAGSDNALFVRISTDANTVDSVSGVFKIREVVKQYTSIT